MRKRQWKSWLIMISSGSIMLQAPGCTVESAAVATSFFSAITAGSVLYLVGQILND